MPKPTWFKKQEPTAQPYVGRSPSSRSFATRWGSPLLFEDGFLGVPTAFLEHYATLGLNAGEAMFFLQLMSFKWNEEAPFPCYKTLSQRMGISIEMARTHAKSLEDKGFLVRVFRKGRSNAFDPSPLSAILLNKVLQVRKEKRAKQAA